MTEQSSQAFSDIIAEAVRSHGQATADLVRRAGAADQDVDLVKEMLECTDRVVQTAARFFVYWDNFSGILDDPKGSAPRYGDSPIGTNACQATQTVTLATGTPTGAVVTSGLRRRGSKGKTQGRYIGPAKIKLDPPDSKGPGTAIGVEVACEGVSRGVYEGVLCVGGTGPLCTGGVATPYNVYVDPSP